MTVVLMASSGPTIAGRQLGIIGERAEPCVSHAPCFPSAFSGTGHCVELEVMPPDWQGCP
jgi:hypothetical protein